MSEATPSHPQHESPEDPSAETPLWRVVVDGEASRARRWHAHGDLLIEQLAEQGGATVQAGLRLWGESLRVGWTLGRRWQTLTLHAWRRSIDLLR